MHEVYTFKIKIHRTLEIFINIYRMHSICKSSFIFVRVDVNILQSILKMLIQLKVIFFLSFLCIYESLAVKSTRKILAKKVLKSNKTDSLSLLVFNKIIAVFRKMKQCLNIINVKVEIHQK